MILTNLRSLNNTDLMRAYGHHVCWFLHMVIKYFPEDSERRNEVMRLFLDILVEYEQNMLDGDRLIDNLRATTLQGSMMNQHSWWKMFEDRAN